MTRLAPTRQQVLECLRRVARPTGASELAEALGLHPNGARFHLEALVGAGLARRTTEERSVPGRPKVLYAAVPPTGVEVDGYRDLSAVLTEALAQPAATPGEAAEAAGVARGRRLAADLVGARASEPSAGTGASATRATELLTDGLARLGFESTSVATRTGRRIDIVPCPYLDLARARPDVVCAVHRGLMTGVLEQLSAPLEVERLEPFVQPGRCTAHLRRRVVGTQSLTADEGADAGVPTRAGDLR